LLRKKPLVGPLGKPRDGFSRLLAEVGKYQKKYWKELE